MIMMSKRKKSFYHIVRASLEEIVGRKHWPFDSYPTMTKRVVRLPLLWSTVAIAICMLAENKLGRFPYVTSFCPPSHILSHSTTSSVAVDKNNSRLLAKPKNKGKKKNIANSNRNFETSAGSELPANLKRKVEAKRLPLGHIVPEATKVKGCELILIDDVSGHGR